MSGWYEEIVFVFIPFIINIWYILLWSIQIICFVSLLFKRNFGSPHCCHWVSCCLCSGQGAQGAQGPGYCQAGILRCTVTGGLESMSPPSHTRLYHWKYYVRSPFFQRCGMCFLNGHVGEGCVNSVLFLEFPDNIGDSDKRAQTIESPTRRHAYCSGGG